MLTSACGRRQRWLIGVICGQKDDALRGPFDAALNLLRRGLVDVDSMIDAHYRLEAGVEAFEKASQKGMLKVILDVD